MRSRKLRTLVFTLSIVLLVAAPGLTAPVELDDAELTGGGPGTGSIWAMDNDDATDLQEGYDQCAAQEDYSFNVDDVTLDGSSDTFDGGPTWLVGMTPFVDGDDMGDLTGQTIKAGPETMGPFQVSVTHTALQDKAVLRSLLTLKNTSNKVKATTVVFDSAHGTDMGLRGSSTEDFAWTKADRWILISDYSRTATRPYVAYALHGPGKPQSKVRNILYRPWDSEVGDGEDCVTVDYRIRVPAGKTRHVAVLTRVIENDFLVGAARNEARKFNGNQAQFFQGVPAGVKTTIVNWDL